MSFEPVRRILRRAASPQGRGVLLAMLAGGALVAVIGIGAFVATQSGPPANTALAPTFTYQSTWSLLDLQRHIESGDVLAISLSTETNTDQSIVAKTVDNQLVRVNLAVTVPEAVSALQGFGYGNLMTSEALAAGKGTTTTSTTEVFRSIVGWLLPALLVGLLLMFVLRGRGRGLQGDKRSSIGTLQPLRRKTDVPDPNAPWTAPAVRLEDVAGVDEAKLELTETIEFLRSPEKFHELGARIPRGIMLYGPPGTGKTMLARAVATEAGVPFYYASGSDFVEKYVGVGAKRIRDLFARARKSGRGVIFLDEFDAIGKARGGLNSHEEREQTLNALLVELDGFSTTEDVIVIAATNRIDVLDAAVLRPGRFSRKIHVGLPDVVGRFAILKVHVRNKPIAASGDLEGIARKTYGFSGAQLADLLNEAAILTARRGGTEITPHDLHQGWLKVAIGTSRHRSMDGRERSIIAAHEVGHAICGKVFGDKRRVEEISLFAHGEALGVTVSSQEDNDLPSESDLRARLVALMGGRAAEELLFKEVTGGASSDFDKANQIAVAMVTKWGMGRDPESRFAGTSGRGSLSFLVSLSNESLPTDVQAAATRAIRALLDDAYAQALSTLTEHMTTLRRIASHLVEHERVDGDTFDALFDNSRPGEATEEVEWRPLTSRPRAWADIAAFSDNRRTLGLAAGAGEPAPVPVIIDMPVPGRDVPTDEPRSEPPAPIPTPARRASDGRPAARRARGHGLLGVLRGGRGPAPASAAAFTPAAAITPTSVLQKRLRARAADILRHAESWVGGPE